ncbi:MAG: VOC family protein [Candidatus Baltobacteraceae bacterium]|jgi:predicted enzyme related to lactoylglutathione lyase
MATTAATISGIDATYYTVKDLERATAFYRDVLGLSVTHEVPGMVTEFSFGGGETFGLYKTGEEEWHASGGVMFAVPDVPGAVAELKGRGVAFAGDGYVDETPVCFMAFGQDSEGNGFILHQRKTA